MLLANPPRARLFAMTTRNLPRAPAPALRVRVHPNPFGARTSKRARVGSAPSSPPTPRTPIPPSTTKAFLEGKFFSSIGTAKKSIFRFWQNVRNCRCVTVKTVAPLAPAAPLGALRGRKLWLPYEPVQRNGRARLRGRKLWLPYQPACSATVAHRYVAVNCGSLTSPCSATVARTATWP